MTVPIRQFPSCPALNGDPQLRQIGRHYTVVLLQIQQLVDTTKHFSSSYLTNPSYVSLFLLALWHQIQRPRLVRVG